MEGKHTATRPDTNVSRETSQSKNPASLPAFNKNKIYRRQQPNRQDHRDEFFKTYQQQKGRKKDQKNHDKRGNFFYECFSQH